jgi:hypothetical protein
VRFNGTAISLVTAKTRSDGKARVYIDDVLAGTVDLYSSVPLFRQTVFSRTGFAMSMTVEN